MRLITIESLFFTILVKIENTALVPSARQNANLTLSGTQFFEPKIDFSLFMIIVQEYFCLTFFVLLSSIVIVHDMTNV